MKEFLIPVTFEVVAKVRVDAESVEDALAQLDATESLGDIALNRLTQAEYIYGSLEVLALEVMED